MRIINLICLIIIILFLACSKEKEGNAKIRLGVPLRVSYLPVFIAEEKGIFKKNGIDVELHIDENLSELYAERKLDIICTGLTESILSTSEGHFSKIIYRFTYSITNDLIVSNNSIKDMESLKKKKISFEGINSSSHIFVQQLLSKKGIQDGEYFAVNLPMHKVIQELEKGTIDAGHTTGVSLSEINKKGLSVIGKSSDDPDLLADTLVADSAFLEKHKQKVKLLVSSIIEAKSFYDSNPEEGVSVFVNYSKRKKEDIKEELSGIKFLSQVENEAALEKQDDKLQQTNINESPKFDFSQGPKDGAKPPGGILPDQSISMNRKEKRFGLLTAGQKIIQFLRERGQLYRMPDLQSIIDDQFVKAGGDK